MGYSGNGPMNRAIKMQAQRRILLVNGSVDAAGNEIFEWPVSSPLSQSTAPRRFIVYQSLDALIADLTEEEQIALSLIDPDLSMSEPQRRKSATDILEVIDCDERISFAERMCSGRVFSRCGPNIHVTTGYIWQLDPSRHSEVLKRIEYLRDRTIEDEIRNLELKTEAFAADQVTYENEAELVSEHLSILDAQREELDALETRLKAELEQAQQQRAAVTDDMTSFAAALADTQQRRLTARESAAQANADLATKRTEREGQLAARAERLDSITSELDKLTPEELQELLAHYAQPAASPA